MAAVFIMKNGLAIPTNKTEKNTYHHNNLHGVFPLSGIEWRYPDGCKCFQADMITSRGDAIH